MINKLKIFLYFIVIGWFAWIMNALKEGRKAKSELLIKDYDLKKEDIENALQKQSIDQLVSTTNKLYKPGGGDNKN